MSHDSPAFLMPDRVIMSTEDVDPRKLLEDLEGEDADALKQRLIDRVRQLLKEKYVNRDAFNVISHLVK